MAARQSSLKFFGLFAVLTLVISPILQAVCETAYWLVYGSWYSFSFSRMFFISSFEDYYQTSFVGLNRVINFLINVWVSIPISLTAALVFASIPFAEKTSKDRVLTFDQFQFGQRNTFDQLQDIHHEVSLLRKELSDLNSILHDLQKNGFDREDKTNKMVGVTAATAENVNDSVRAIERLELKLASIDLDVHAMKTWQEGSNQ